MRSAILAPLLAISAVLACGDDLEAGSTGADSGTDAGSSSGTDPTTDGEASTGAATTGMAPTTSGADGTDGQSTGAATTGAATTGDTTTGEPSEWDGEPLPPAPPGAWTWIDFPDARCRNGTTTGIGVRYGDSDRLAIFFEGGGACFNTATCLLNDGFSNFGNLQFQAWAGTLGQGGIFDRDAADNPVADWNFVYVPYCTGDVHAGDKEDAGVPGVFGAQQFVGYRNVALYLERLVPSFADTSHVLVTGQSAGGFGAAFNYDRIADAWPNARVTLLDDSGPPFSDMYLAPCLQEEWRGLWNLDATLPIDCDDCFGPNGGGISNLAPYLAAKHPDQRFALFSSVQDAIIRTFFGYGMNNCLGGVMTGEMFEAGLHDLRDDVLGDDPVWASYYAPGMGHTITSGPGYYTTEVDGVRLVDWLAALIAGETSHIGG